MERIDFEREFAAFDPTPLQRTVFGYENPFADFAFRLITKPRNVGVGLLVDRITDEVFEWLDEDACPGFYEETFRIHLKQILKDALE